MGFAGAAYRKETERPGGPEVDDQLEPHVHPEREPTSVVAGPCNNGTSPEETLAAKTPDERMSESG